MIEMGEIPTSNTPKSEHLCIRFVRKKHQCIVMVLLGLLAFTQIPKTVTDEIVRQNEMPDVSLLRNVTSSLRNLWSEAKRLKVFDNDTQSLF